MNFDNWKARPHYLGLLMTNSKTLTNAQKLEKAGRSLIDKLDKFDSTKNKETVTAGKLALSITELEEKIELLKLAPYSPDLSQTAMSKLQEIWTTETSGRTKDIKNKFINKGLDLEEDALTQLSLSFNDGTILNKNKKGFENDWLISDGIDSIIKTETFDYGFDTKCSWDIFSFDKQRFQKLNPLYYWQAQGYCDGHGLDQVKISFNLLDTPEYLIQSEERKLSYELFGCLLDSNSEPSHLSLWKEACEELRRNHIYKDLPLKRKIQNIVVERDDEAIEKAKSKVEVDCRYYLNNIENIKTDEQEEETI